MNGKPNYTNNLNKKRFTIIVNLFLLRGSSVSLSLNILQLAEIQMIGLFTINELTQY